MPRIALHIAYIYIAVLYLLVPFLFLFFFVYVKKDRRKKGGYHRSMNKETIFKRLDTVSGSTSNVVVALGAWMALHAHDADKVLGCVEDRLKSPHTKASQRRALVFALHELLLTCSRAKETTEETKEKVLVNVSRILPRAVEVVLSSSFGSDRSDVMGFALALEKALDWWALLQLFTPSWLNGMRSKLQAFLTAHDVSYMFNLKLQRFVQYMGKYQEAKTRAQSEGTMNSNGGKDAQRLLVLLGKLRLRDFPGSKEFEEWYEAEQREWQAESSNGSTGMESLRIKTERNADGEVPQHAVHHSGHAEYTIPHVAAGNEVKEEGSTVAKTEEGGDDDDVLGSFF